MPVGAPLYLSLSTLTAELALDQMLTPERLMLLWIPECLLLS